MLFSCAAILTDPAEKYKRCRRNVLDARKERQVALHYRPARWRSRYARAFARLPHGDIEHQLPLRREERGEYAADGARPHPASAGRLSPSINTKLDARRASSLDVFRYREVTGRLDSDSTIRNTG